MSEIERSLDNFVGQEFDLTAVALNRKYGDDDAACTICFTLDGHTYMAAEDRQDGYRSSLGSIQVVERAIKNTFPACRVKCEWPPVDDDWNENTSRVLFRSVATNKLILEVGTDYSDGYYPSFVASFQPENMDVNADKAVPCWPAKSAEPPRPEGWATW